MLILRPDSLTLNRHRFYGDPVVTIQEVEEFIMQRGGDVTRI